MLVKSGVIVVDESIPHPFTPDIYKAKYFTVKGSKKLLYISTFMSLRVYVNLINFTKKNWSALKIKVQNLNRKNHIDNLSSGKEVNKFLRVVSDYKKKISIMKRRIDQEEKGE